MTACSWSSSKWAHYRRPGGCVVRVSAGRTDDRRWLDLEPAETCRRPQQRTGRDRCAPRPGSAARQPRACTRGSCRWRRSLPQYRPGHLDRVSAVESCLAAEVPGWWQQGAAFGVWACPRACGRLKPRPQFSRGPYCAKRSHRESRPNQQPRGDQPADSMATAGSSHESRSMAAAGSSHESRSMAAAGSSHESRSMAAAGSSHESRSMAAAGSSHESRSMAAAGSSHESRSMAAAGIESREPQHGRGRIESREPQHGRGRIESREPRRHRAGALGPTRHRPRARLGGRRPRPGHCPP